MKKSYIVGVFIILAILAVVGYVSFVVPPKEAVADTLILNKDGIGALTFGTPMDTVVAEISEKIGSPSEGPETKKIGACEQFVSITSVHWHNLGLIFGTSNKKFLQYYYGPTANPKATTPLVPALHTADNITLGSEDTLLALYPQAKTGAYQPYGGGYATTFFDMVPTSNPTAAQYVTVEMGGDQIVSLSAKDTQGYCDLPAVSQ